ncbi:unnamed protein product [Vitrella brassicaformis CCMP3155]|uniref:Uncharacterized protein n=2 Tax=Vitrella brassicaformis TaxID=1169539 RepID=A0A0G4EF35_VITBC|nr:unnamed protein product [Vitrella brassicaformis CCMP3155]|eukprot:CEL94030.1 unnamed protein product [Vitrella brassicaformis CCMP3155]
MLRSCSRPVTRVPPPPALFAPPCSAHPTPHTPTLAVAAAATGPLRSCFPHDNTSVFAASCFGSSLGSVRTLIRNPFWRRRGWHPWRRRLVRHQNLDRRRRRHIWPRFPDPEEDPPRSGPPQTWSYKTRVPLKLSAKRLTAYARLIKGLHLQDAIDWMAAIPVHRLQPVFNTLQWAQEQLSHKYHADPGRLYIASIMVNKDNPTRYLRVTRKDWGRICSWNNTMVITIKMVSYTEFFHRLYILGKVPRSMSTDMRIAIKEHRVGAHVIREWWPYLASDTRLQHRMTLKWLDNTRQFDYYGVRRDWILQYQANLLRRFNEMRSARGLENAVTLRQAHQAPKKELTRRRGPISDQFWRHTGFKGQERVDTSTSLQERDKRPTKGN